MNMRTMQDRIYLAIIDTVHVDRYVHAAWRRRGLIGLHEYAASIEKNPNQTQVAQRIFARAIADRLDGK